MTIDIEVPSDRPDPAPFRLCVLMGLGLLVVLLALGTDERVPAEAAVSSGVAALR